MPAGAGGVILRLRNLSGDTESDRAIKWRPDTPGYRVDKALYSSPGERQELWTDTLKTLNKFDIGFCVDKNVQCSG